MGQAKKAILYFVSFFGVAFGILLFGLLSTTSAQTVSDDIESLSKEELRTLVSELRTEINDLKGQVNTLKAEQLGFVRLKQELRRGMTGDEVRRLQEFLATDPTNSPGFADGQFGPRTEASLARFQEKFGLEVKGFLTPETIELINKILESEDVTTQVPPGLLIAPGLKDRVKVRVETKNGRFEYKIEVEKDDDSDDDSDDEESDDDDSDNDDSDDDSDDSDDDSDDDDNSGSENDDEDEEDDSDDSDDDNDSDDGDDEDEDGDDEDEEDDD